MTDIPTIPTTPTTAPGSTPKRGRGRPPGSTNRPKPKPSPSSTPKPPPAPADDANAQRIADALAAAATPPSKPSEGGRPTARTSALSALADQLATAYTAAGAMIAVGGRALSISEQTRNIGARLVAVGDELAKNADACGLALARWADTNPAVKAWLSRISTGSGALMVIAAHAPILAAAFGKPPELGTLAATLIAPADDGAPLAPVFDLSAMFASLAGNPS